MYRILIMKLVPFRRTSLESQLSGGVTRGSVVVKALRYKPEGRGFDTR
jgi:hypothetical protein